MLPNREGLFNALPVDIGVDESGPNKLATCIINFHLYDELQQSGEWADCAAEGLEITGYFYLEKKDGSLNTITIDSLKAALGWDGRDPFWLQEADLSQHGVQVKLAFEEYGGKTRLKVQFLNPLGSTGSRLVTRADPPARKAITNRMGPKLRALAGPAQPATPKPVSPPKLPPASPAEASAKAGKPKAPPVSPPPPEPVPVAEATMEQAWEEFARHCPPEKWDQEAVEREWFRVLALLFPGRQPGELSPTEWGTMRDRGPSEIIPF